MEGARAAWMLLALVAGASAAPPTPTGTKRSGENIQFGNQQNPPVSLLDDNAMAGAFPSSETIEELPTPVAQTQKQQEVVAAAVAVAAQAVVAGLKEEQKEQQEKQRQQQQQQQQQQQEQQDQQKPQQEQREKQEDKDENVEEVDRDSKEEEGRQQAGGATAAVAGGGGGGGEEQRWDDETNLWHNQPAAHDFYRSYLNVPRIIGNGVPSLATRRRRSLHLPPLRSHPIKGGTLAGMRTLLGRGPQRHKRDLRRFRRDLNMNGVDLDRLLKNVDMKELLTLLSRPQHHQEGYGTVHYTPTPARYAPQAKLYPDYEDEWGKGVEDLLRQGLRAEQPAEGVSPVAVVMPPSRVWRKSSAPPGYGLARVPGFKRSSAFRSNTLQDTPPQAPRPYSALNPRDVYSLAAMLGAERDPLTHRIRRAVM